MAIGVSWAVGWSTGLASSIAIILHELPHELGDFVIYKKFGLSNAKALGANLFAACVRKSLKFIKKPNSCQKMKLCPKIKIMFKISASW